MVVSPCASPVVLLHPRNSHRVVDHGVEALRILLPLSQARRIDCRDEAWDKAVLGLEAGKVLGESVEVIVVRDHLGVVVLL
jgi:hypothetical protein